MNKKSKCLRSSFTFFWCLLSTLLLLQTVDVQQALADESSSGDPMLYALNADGHVIQRTADNGGHVLHRGEIMSIAVNNVFLRALDEHFTGNHHVLVYAEVFDDGTDNPENAYKKIIYNQEMTAARTNLGIADKIIYGPAEFKGYPIRIKFFVIQLRKEEKGFLDRLFGKENTNNIVQMLPSVAAPALGAILSFAANANALKGDDFELRYDVTLDPAPQLLNSRRLKVSPTSKAESTSEKESESVNVRYITTPLRTGSLVIFKRELVARNLSPPEKIKGARPMTIGNIDYARESFYWPTVCTSDFDIILNIKTSQKYDGGYFFLEPKQPLEYGDGTTFTKNTVFQKETSDPLKSEEDNKVIENIKKQLRKCPWLMDTHYRIPDASRTSIVFSVSTGIKGAVLDEQSMRSASKRELDLITSLTIAPPTPQNEKALADFGKDLASSLKVMLRQRRIEINAANVEAVDQNFRTSSAYPLYWIHQLILIDAPLNADPGKMNYATEMNRVTLSKLREILINLSDIDLDVDAPSLTLIQFLRKLGESDIKPYYEEHPKIGLFRVDESKINEFKDAATKNKK